MSSCGFYELSFACFIVHFPLVCCVSDLDTSMHSKQRSAILLYQENATSDTNIYTQAHIPPTQST